MGSGNSSIFLEAIHIVGFKRFQAGITVELNERNNVLVGDNCIGKSTILEAIHLALSGKFRNEPIGRAISPYLFNTDAIAKFIATSGTPDCILPEIRIEAYLGGVEKGELVDFEGAINSKHERLVGFALTISPDRAYASDLYDKVRSESFQSLPVEYYSPTWMTFSNAPTSLQRLPIRSALINPGGEWGAIAVDERAVRSIVECLDPDICRSIAGDVRTSRDGLSSASGLVFANGSVEGIEVLGGGTAMLAAKKCTRDSWIKDLTVQVGDVPFAHIGSGSQCILQTQVALERHPSAKKASIVLYEEPENHLSHAHLRELMEAVLRTSGKQTVFSTHSSFVANKLDLGNLLIVPDGDDGACKRLSNLNKETRRYFEKLAGYDTLRVVLASRSILVEGPSDELIVQKLYRDSHGGRLPIEDGIDIISVSGLSFKRFLDLAILAKKQVAVITDNDGHLESIAKKYENYSEDNGVMICSPEDIRGGTEGDGVKNWNTLEPELIEKNGWEAIAEKLKKQFQSETELVIFMESNKTNCALELSGDNVSLECPDYIAKAFKWVER